CLTAAGCYPEAEDMQPQALELARMLKARRYEAIILCNCAEIALVKGRRAEALAFARQGREISEATGLVGPIVLGLLALLEDRRGRQQGAPRAVADPPGRGCAGQR